MEREKIQPNASYSRTSLYCYLNQFLWHKARVNHTEHLYSYLRFSDNIMYTTGPDIIFWSTEATVIYACKIEIWRFARHSFLEEKSHYVCLLSSEAGDDFHRLLELALAPDKTNEGVKKQWCIH